MNESIELKLKYPVGRFVRPQNIAEADLAAWINDIEDLPERLAAAVNGLQEDRLETPYRPGGWTVRQVVHHLADSHMNSYIRFRLALTEDSPRIKPYREAAWAQLPDAKNSPIDVSLDLLRALHARWVVLLRSMPVEDFARTFEHPENGPMRLDISTALYSWHGRHHLAHISSVVGR